ncbi:Fasciclin-1 [Acromyrmex echinatior]|uniref:Fasciclin-1 n=1 Tax=Acromyrmex echinatior TaxID=103372 RepID=F4WXV7_ACREC|nr:Fasciclin-1 [Acromyrmex echinatior]
MSTITHLHDVTLFAPSNEALNEPNVKQMLQDKNRMKEILKLHYVKERLTLDKIKDKSVSQKSSFPSGDSGDERTESELTWLGAIRKFGFLGLSGLEDKKKFHAGEKRRLTS